MRPRAVFFLLFSALVACHDDKPKTEQSAAASAEPIPSDLVYNSFVDDKTTKPEIATDGGVDSTSSTAKLVDAGADPKSPLRYAFSTKTRTVDSTMTIATAGSDGNIPAQPPLHFVFTATPKLKSMLGHDATVDVTVSKFDVALPANASAQMVAGKADLEKSLVGVTGHFDVTQFGDVGDVAFNANEIPRNAADVVNVLQQAFELLVIPLPNEPVGVGAKWEKSDSKRMADQGATVSLKTTITLTARDAHTATFQVDNTASGTMAVNDPRAPKGMSVARKTTASYTVSARLDGVSAKVDGTSNTDVTQNVPGQPAQTVTIKMTQHLTSK